MDIDMRNIATFGVAGNFTGHLEQAGEASDFVNVKVAEANAPKAIFPTYIPNANNTTIVPEHLKSYPWSFTCIEYPENQDKLQIEPECAILCNATWDDNKLVALSPIGFGASNDCSIRREGAKKISLKKNWGTNSKGFSANILPIDSFNSDGTINDYRIASFLVRDGIAYAYGEDSKICDYSYVYDKLISWMLDKFNNQSDEGPAEDIHSYLLAAGCPSRILISIGATRYTKYGETNFLKKGDHSVVVLYPESKYSFDDVVKMLESDSISDPAISVLDQIIK